jgi:hypothetical protein
MTEPARWWKNAYVLALIGLGLMFGGWKASTYNLLPSRIVFGAGLLLFVAAGVLMWRHQPAPVTDEEPEPDPDEEREPGVF